MSLQPLHPGLHHVHWSVPKHAGCSSYPSDAERANVSDIFRVVSSLKVAFEIGIDKESDGLVCSLFDDGWSEPLVGASYTWVGGRGGGGA